MKQTLDGEELRNPKKNPKEPLNEENSNQGHVPKYRQYTYNTKKANDNMAGVITNHRTLPKKLNYSTSQKKGTSTKLLPP